MEQLVPIPTAGRTFTSERRIRLSDRDASGRLRLDAVARYLQDVAMDDVDETGWGAPDHLWVLRHVRIEVMTPVIEDDRVELTTWCSGTAAVAAGRRMSLSGDRGGRMEVESAWIHLGPDARPARIVDFGLYADAAGGRAVSTRLELPVPQSDGVGATWPLRVTDVDLLGHVNNAAYWHAIEQRLLTAGLDPLLSMRARLDHRHPVDFPDDVELVESVEPGRLGLGFTVEGVVNAVAWVENRSYALSRQRALPS